MLMALLLAASLALQTVSGELPPLEELPGHGSTTFEPFSFVQIGDPQIGYHSTWPAARRLERLARELESTQVEFGIVVGDLVQDRLWLEKRLLRGALPRFSVPLAFVPGNHDVLDAETLAAYREEFGADYHAFVYKGCGFIGLDSELFEDELPEHERAAQWEWFVAELERMGELDLRHVFLFLHRPLFTRPDHEPPEDPLVGAIREHGIRHVLAGHLHRTVEIEANDGAYTTYVVGGTARVTDDRGYGYRVFDVTEAGVEQRYVEFDRPWDFWLARLGWSPRIVDPSLPHWILTLVFLATARLCWRARAPVDPDRDPDDPFGPPWRAIAAAYLFLGLSLQLDFDEVFAATGRGIVYELGLAGERRFLQQVVLAAGILVFVVALAVGRRRLRDAGRYGGLALLGLGLPATSFLLHMLSLHQTEFLLYTLGRNGLYVIEGAGAALSAWAAVRARRSQASARASLS